MDTIKHLSPNFNERPDGAPVDILVLHYTGMPTAEAALERLCDPAAEVSAHYLIDENSSVFELVPETKRAWHAGVSSWRGNTNINDRSIGIELANPGHEFGYRPFTEAQLSALITLGKEIISRHPIPPRNIIGHSDIAPTRKSDPGELFNWELLAKNGIGLMPDLGIEPPLLLKNTFNFENALNFFGYDTTDLTAATLAFQRHFMPEFLNGEPNTATIKALKSLLSKIQSC